MKNTRFLALEEIVILHSAIVDVFGGSHGIRDLGLLESAINQPQASFGGTLRHSSLAEMAAAYLFHIIKNHPFVDGNKRTGSAVAILFLNLNGYITRLTNIELYDLALATAISQLTKENIAHIIKPTMQPFS